MSHHDQSVEEKIGIFYEYSCNAWATDGDHWSQELAIREGKWFLGFAIAAAVVVGGSLGAELKTAERISANQVSSAFDLQSRSGRENHYKVATYWTDISWRGDKRYVKGVHEEVSFSPVRVCQKKFL